MTSADTTGTTGSWRAVLRDPTFARVWISQLTSSLGDQMFPFAIATTVLIEDDSVTGFGAVLAARALGMALCVLIGEWWPTAFRVSGSCGASTYCAPSSSPVRRWPCSARRHGRSRCWCCWSARERPSSTRPTSRCFPGSSPSGNWKRRIH